MDDRPVRQVPYEDPLSDDMTGWSAPIPYPPEPSRPESPPQWPLSPPPTAPMPGTNGFAIASLVFGVLAGVVLSVVFGLIALSKIRRTGQSGKGMAIAGLVLSGLWVLGGAAMVVAASLDGEVSVGRVHVGDCVATLSESSAVYRLPVVPCSQPHQGEVFGEFDLPGGDYPGDAAIEAAARQRCAPLVDGYAPEGVGSADSLYFLYPRSTDWRRGDRTVTCVAYSDRPVTGSLTD